MGQLITGILLIVFGLVVGGAGIATAGIGIGIPMIPLGIYILIRGGRTLLHESKMEEKGTYIKQEAFESTAFGKFAFGIILILIGIATSALIIGIPVIIVGVVLIISSFKSKVCEVD